MITRRDLLKLAPAYLAASLGAGSAFAEGQALRALTEAQKAQVAKQLAAHQHGDYAVDAPLPGT